MRDTRYKKRDERARKQSPCIAPDTVWRVLLSQRSHNVTSWPNNYDNSIRVMFAKGSSTDSSNKCYCARSSGVIRSEHVVKDTGAIIVVYLMSGTFSLVRYDTRDWSKKQKKKEHINNNNKYN